MDKKLIIVRGAGDLATGVIACLHSCGMKVVALETEKPSSIRRKVCLSEAIYQGEMQVEDTVGILAGMEEIDSVLESGAVPVVIDPEGECIRQCKPDVVVDAILAKRNLGTTKEMAPLVIGLGPGFTAGEDVDLVIETMRGHDLGRIIEEGSALSNTGVPGMVGGYSKERVLYSPAAGTVHAVKCIGDIVQEGEVIAYIDSEPVPAKITGVLRGLLPEGYQVKAHFKMGDIDPRIEEQKNCETISDKARCLGGSVLQAILMHEIKKETMYV